MSTDVSASSAAPRAGDARDQSQRTAAPNAAVLVALSALTVAVLDGAFAIVLYVVLGSSTISKLFQGIASALIGRGAYSGGSATVALGIALHVTVALAWSVIFLLAFRASKLIPRMLAWKFGALDVAVWYGPLIYVVMSMALIPLFTHRVPPITMNWVIVLLGHIPFVGLPIALIVGRASPEWSR